MPDPLDIVNPPLDQIASVGVGIPVAPGVEAPATIGVTDATGRPIPDASISSAIATGEAQFAPDRVYDLLDPDGIPKRVRGEHVYSAMQRGWALESPEGKELRLARENATLGDKLKAGIYGAGEGLTLGTLPGLVEGFGGKEGIKAYRKTKAASEEAGTIGEVLSLLTPIGVEGLAARGIGTASKLGRGGMLAAEVATAEPRHTSKSARAIGGKVAGAIPESTTALGQALRKGAQFGVEGAVEGSVYGAGFAVGEASLGDKELTAERLLASVGSGALLGVGIGGGLGVASVGASRAANRIGAELPGFAEKMAFRSTGARGSEMRRLGMDQVQRSGRRMLDESLVGFGSLEERAAAIEKARVSAGKEIDRFVRGIDDLGHRPDLTPIINRIDEQLGELRAGLKPGDDIRLARKIERDYADQLRDSMLSGKATFKQLHSFRARIDDYREAAKRSGNVTAQAELNKLRQTVEEELQAQADKIANQVGGDFSAGYTAAKARYKDLVDIAKISKDQAAARSATTFGVGDRAIGIAGLLTAGPAGLMAAGVSKLAREHGDAAVALLADKVSKKTTKPSLAEVLGGAPKAANDIVAPPAIPKLKPLDLDEIVKRASAPVNDNARRAARKAAASIDDAQKHFDEMAAKAEEVSKSGGYTTSLDQFLNSERSVVSRAERDAIKNEISDQVTKFLKEAQKAGADYKGQVFRGTTERELQRLTDSNGTNARTWSVSKDPDGAAHFAKRGGALVIIPENSGAIPVDALTNSNTFAEALIPKGSSWKIVDDQVKDGVRVVTLEPKQAAIPRTSDVPDHLLFGPGMPGASPANDIVDFAAMEKAAKKEAKSKLEALGYVKEKADKVALQISKGAKDAVSIGSHKVTPKIPAGAAAYEALAADAREHRMAPDRSAVKIAARVAPLVESAPQLASAVNAKLTGDLGYLASKLPAAGLAGLSPEQAKNVVPSGSGRAAFVRQARAIADPKTLLFDMKKGRLSDDALEAIKERRPLLLAKIQEEAEAAYAQLVKEGRAPSRQARLQFEKLTGRIVDPASNPMVVKVVQSIYQEQAAALATPTTPSPQSSSKRANRLMSQSETLAYGEF